MPDIRTSRLLCRMAALRRRAWLWIANRAIVGAARSALPHGAKQVVGSLFFAALAIAFLWVLRPSGGQVRDELWLLLATVLAAGAVYGYRLVREISADTYPERFRRNWLAILFALSCVSIASISSIGVRSYVAAGSPLARVQGPRPDIRLEAEDILVDLTQRVVFVSAKNYGDRITSEGRIFYHPHVTDSMAVAWSFHDLAPGQEIEAQFQLSAHKGSSFPLGLIMIDADQDFSFSLYACHFYGGVDQFTSEYVVYCVSGKGICRIASGPPRAGACLERKGVVNLISGQQEVQSRR